MIFPMMQTPNVPSRSQVIEFEGYDVRNVIEPGSMRDMMNLSTDEYPCLYQRKQRGVYSAMYYEPDAILARRGKLAVCDSTAFWYDGQRVFDLEQGIENRQMQAINTRIVIYPDKLYYNTETGEHGSLGYRTEPLSVTFRKDATTQETTCTFVLSSPDDLKGFKEGDTISFKGMSTSIVGHSTGKDNNISNAIIQRIDLDNNAIRLEAGVINYPTASEEDFTDTGESGEGFTIEREVPDLDFVLEYNNRLYGTKGNTIFASKLGDPTNWYFYGTGTAESSYSVEVGTDGDFTGIAAYPTHIIFFKENYMHKLYGYKPANYQLITTPCHGLEKGSHRSVQAINGTIFYKAREGIMAYSGDTPYLISHNFGNDRYDSASAGTDGVKYYVSMRNKADGKWYFFVFDADRSVWILEDDTHAREFTRIDNDLVYSDEKRNAIISVIGSGEGIDTKPIEWYAKFGEYDEFTENKKVYSRIEMRLKMEEHSEINVWMSIDGGAWESVYHLDTYLKRTVEMPIVPRRCDKFAILIRGKGYVKIESMTRIMREGTMR